LHWQRACDIQLEKVASNEIGIAIHGVYDSSVHSFVVWISVAWHKGGVANALQTSSSSEKWKGENKESSYGQQCKVRAASLLCKPVDKRKGWKSKIAHMSFDSTNSTSSYFETDWAMES
jgi:hypothetical protein